METDAKWLPRIISTDSWLCTKVIYVLVAMVAIKFVADVIPANPTLAAGRNR